MMKLPSFHSPPDGEDATVDVVAADRRAAYADYDNRALARGSRRVHRYRLLLCAMKDYIARLQHVAEALNRASALSLDLPVDYFDGL